MLLSKKRPELGSIVVLKLVTGEEVIGKLSVDNGATIEVSTPIGVGMAGNGQVAMVPFMVGLPDKVDVPFNMSSVIVYSNARDELRDAYIQNTTSIMPASASDLQGIKGSDQGAKATGPAVGGFNPNK